MSSTVGRPFAKGVSGNPRGAKPGATRIKHREPRGALNQVVAPFLCRRTDAVRRGAGAGGRRRHVGWTAEPHGAGDGDYPRDGAAHADVRRLGANGKRTVALALRIHGIQDPPVLCAILTQQVVIRQAKGTVERLEGGSARLHALPRMNPDRCKVAPLDPTRATILLATGPLNVLAKGVAGVHLPGRTRQIQQRSPELARSVPVWLELMAPGFQGLPGKNILPMTHVH